MVIELGETNRTKNYNKKIDKIPLKNESYVLVEGNFQLINRKKMNKLETKMLSTYRHSSAIRKRSIHYQSKMSSAQKCEKENS